jgi:hypothetical protein
MKFHTIARQLQRPPFRKAALQLLTKRLMARFQEKIVKCGAASLPNHAGSGDNRELTARCPGSGSEPTFRKGRRPKKPWQGMMDQDRRNRLHQLTMTSFVFEACPEGTAVK